MSLFGLFSGDKKSTTNTTQNTTQVYNSDSRTAASDSAIAVGEGGLLDQSIYFRDQSRTSYADNSVTNLMTSDPETTRIATRGAVELGLGAFGLVNDGLAAQLASQRENNSLAQSYGELLAANTRASLAAVIDVVGDAASRGQDASDAARIGAQDTIKEVLASKEAGEVKVIGDLGKYAAIIAAIIAIIFIFRGKK